MNNQGAPGAAVRAIEPGTCEPPEIDVTTGTTAASEAAKPSAPAVSGFPSATEMAQKTTSSAAAAGGIPAADQRPTSASTITINLNELLEAGDLHNNIPLLGGDV